MAAPCALIASCSAFNPKEIVKKILDVEDLPEAQRVVESVQSYDWHIDTKYYTADVLLCTTINRTIGDQSFAESVQAFVVYFDSHEVSSFEQVKSWLPYLSHINPPVQILVCQTSRQEDAVSRLTAQQWCIENGFELVELEPEENSDDEDCDFVESNGVKRIIQALHAHTWPNLELKSRLPVCSPYFRNLMHEEAALKASAAAIIGEDERSDASKTVSSEECLGASASSQGDAAAAAVKISGCQDRDGSKTAVDSAGDAGSVEKEETTEVQANGSSAVAGKKPSLDDLVPDDSELAMLAALGNDDPGEESFEQIFTKLRLMKEKASTLPPEERKSYAEKIAVTFWRAVGGDEDEIEGLFDDVESETT